MLFRPWTGIVSRFQRQYKIQTGLQEPLASISCKFPEQHFPVMEEIELLSPTLKDFAAPPLSKSV